VVSPGLYRARWGYQNYTGMTVTIAVSADNGFAPAPLDRGQPTTFNPGRIFNAVIVEFTTTTLRWSIRAPGGSIVSSTARPRATTPAC
jgi:hypothetical protein